MLKKKKKKINFCYFICYAVIQTGLQSIADEKFHFSRITTNGFSDVDPRF